MVNLIPACVYGLTVDVNGGASPGANVTSINWNWGDGEQGTGYFPRSHNYTSSGTYTIQVTADYDDGSTGFASQQVTVGPSIDANCLTLTVTAGVGGAIVYQSSLRSGMISNGSFTFHLAAADDLGLSAEPGTDYTFSGWIAGPGITGAGGAPLATETSPILIVVDANSRISANFTDAPQPS
jgi:hypothetical protein